jgi:hypothetical protein
MNTSPLLLPTIAGGVYERITSPLQSRHTSTGIRIINFLHTLEKFMDHQKPLLPSAVHGG